MSKILITGGAGYIGSHAVKLFLEKGHEVVVIDNLYRGYKEALDALSILGKLTFCKADLRDRGAIEQVFKKHKFDCVLHFAALCLVTESMEKPNDYFENNVLGTLNLLEVMRENNCKSIVFSSTCAVYGESQYLPIDELHPTNPTNPYGESKLMVEKMIKWYSEIYGFNYVIFRYFNVCGADPLGTIGDSKHPSVLLVQNAVRGVLGIEPFKLTYPKVETPDGSPIRDYIDVTDLASVHYLGYEYLKKGGKSELFNLGNGLGYSVLEIVTAVEGVMGVTISRTQGDTRKGEYAKVYASNAKVRQKLNWGPRVSLRDSIRALERWYRKKPQGFTY